MSYNPINWVNGETPINDTNLNNMDKGITDAHSMLAEHERKINDFANQQLPEEYVKEAVDTYVENNSAGFATAAELVEAKSQLDSVNSEVSKLSSEIVDLQDIGLTEMFSYIALSPTVNYGSIATNGTNTADGNAKYIRTSFASVKKGATITVANGYQMRVALYTDRTQSACFYVEDFTSKRFVISKDCYIRVAVKKEDDSDFTDLSLEGILLIDNAISNKLPFITPEMFGAKGDGTTDDTQALQRMIDSGNGLYCVLSNTYLITEPLKLYNKVGIKFVGTGHNQHGANIVSNKASINMIQIDGCTQISFEYIRFGYVNDGTSNSLKGIVCGLFDESISDHRVNSLRVNQCYFRGLFIGVKIDSGTGYTYIEDCTFQKLVKSGSIVGTAIVIGKDYDSTKYDVSPNYIYINRNNFVNLEAFPFNAIEVFAGYWLEITRNDFANFRFGDYAITLTNTNSRVAEVHIENNYCFASNAFIKCYTSMDKEIATFIVKNNKFLCSNGDLPFIRFDGKYTEETYLRYIRNVVVTDNNFSNTADGNTLVYVNFDYVDGYIIDRNTSYQLRRIVKDSDEKCVLNNVKNNYNS